jgi:cytochrome c-type biogenesis protein
MSIIIEGFLLGMSSILTNVCLLPLYPGMIAFLAGNLDNTSEKKQGTMLFLGVLALLGVLSMMLVLGLLFSAISGIYGNALPYIVLFSYVLVVVLGGMMLFGFNPFKSLSTVQAPLLKNPLATAYLYGVLLAPMTLPCTGPLLLAALARANTSVGAGAILGELVFFLAFGLGFGWPLVLLPIIAVPLQRRFISWMVQRSNLITRVAGGLLLAVGLYGVILDRALFTEIIR